MTARRVLLGTVILWCAATAARAETVVEEWRSLGQPISVSVNPTDGSCWVADTGHQQVVHLAEDGAELWRGGTSSHNPGLSPSTRRMAPAG